MKNEINLQQINSEFYINQHSNRLFTHKSLWDFSLLKYFYGYLMVALQHVDSYCIGYSRVMSGGSRILCSSFRIA